jgi:hypothetical protein
MERSSARLQHVADATDRPKLEPGVRVRQASAQSRDLRFKSVARNLGIEAIQLAFDMRPSNHASGPPYKKLEKRQLTSGKA